jgi:transcriptional regulator of acetoin/glycerol metabolism
MHGPGSGHTTLPLPERAASVAGTQRLSLVWLFPRTEDTPLDLDLNPGDERFVGRDEDCAVRLMGPDVSRRHARILRDGPHLVMTDLGSRNGTFLNGAATQSARIGLGSVIRFGGCVGLVTDCPGPATEMAPGLLAGPLLQAELAPVRQAASSDLPIILEGETGTGKEVVARAIHTWSGRTGPFLAVNCAALPEALAEGELFGYRRGAFTGAERHSPGFFRSANEGTLLLDEVSDLPLAIQAKLLRVLEEREVQPLGESQTTPIDVRIIVATQEPLAQAVMARRFRPDLFARLDGVSVRLPPLRKRLGDVPALFLRQLAKLNSGRTPALEADFVEGLCLHDWPFNVREVVLLAKRLAVLHGQEASLKASHLPARMSHLPEASVASDTTVTPPARSDNEPVELPALIAALRTSQGNVAQAAIVLGISRQRVYRLMHGHSVDLEALRNQDEAEP